LFQELELHGVSLLPVRQGSGKIGKGVALRFGQLPALLPRQLGDDIAQDLQHLFRT
jgi:hypothetical protein